MTSSTIFGVAGSSAEMSPEIGILLAAGMMTSRALWLLRKC